jgi:hypothetical protein
MQEGGALTWREIVDKHHSAMVDELSTHIVAELKSTVTRALDDERSQAGMLLARACEDARRSRTESLNQALRRLRQASGEEQILRLLCEGCAAYTEASVVVVFENNQVRAISSQGFDAPLQPFDIVSAPAILAAIESRDPVIALASEAEISPELASLFKQPVQTTSDMAVDTPEDRAYLFPVSARHSVVAMLIASGPAVSAPIELLCEAAGMRLETLQSSATPKASDLVQLAVSRPAGEAAEKRSWDDLSMEDQRLHLQAQRTARLRVAEMRLYHEGDLHNGLAAGDIYTALRPVIDSARVEFLQTWLSKSPTMVDYLHLEILRSLAGNDDRLLGAAYPGPMV